MEPMILELNKKNCYVIYHNQLIMNVPVKKVDACIESLSRGLPFKNVQIFNLDGRFKISYAEKDDKITFSDAVTSKKTINYEGQDKEKVLAWLKPYLEQSGYNPGAEAVSNSKMLMRGVGTIVLILFIFGMLYAAEGTSARSGKARLFVEIANALGTELILIIGGACLVLSVIWTLIKAKKGDTQITYAR